MYAIPKGLKWRDEFWLSELRVEMTLVFYFLIFFLNFIELVEKQYMQETQREIMKQISQAR